ncbi:hypothetical protein [Pseudoxanthomonas mexicana]|uniref:hypothetical protein n=1 Tax=Pseudoxanthomonas mexicana TaxID=128785 RepID=UPI0028A58E20|nr:hypothetical protein [Pseudoxanthomonas mexicana]
MHSTRNPRMLMTMFLASLLPLAVQTANAGDTRIDNEISADLADARSEVRTELAAARRELDTGNLQLGDSLRFGTSDARASHADRTLPQAEITPQGDFLIEGRPVAIDRHQRQELLLYRGEVIAIAKAGIDIGERSAQAALDAVDRGLFSLMFGAMTGSLERRIEKTVRETVEPGVRQICLSLPALRDRQQRLSATLPAFRPYATLEADDVEDCENEMRREFASR